MKLRHYALLFLCALLLAVGAAQFQRSPGYMDADYYFATGKMVAEGKGFTEPFLWNYLDNPTGLPHPSHAYWMPLASLIAAAGMWIARATEFASARWAFLLLTALIPLVTARLAYALSSRRDVALLAGGLAILSGYYFPFLLTTDTFALYMLLGGLFFLALNISPPMLRALTLGLLAGLMHLSRADGVLWLALAGLALLRSTRPLKKLLLALTVLLGGYLVILAPWFARNLSAFGRALPSGGLQTLWLTRYDQLFSYPSGQLTLQSWLASGWSAILSARWWALKLNLGTMLGVQGSVILLPLILMGAWRLRRDQRVALGGAAWVLTLLAMTIIFPFAGARGGFFHSGAALQPLWWAVAPLGLERAIDWLRRKRNWRQSALPIFRGGLLGVMLLLTAVVFWGRVVGSDARNPVWNLSAQRYRLVESALRADGASPYDVIMVSNPPGYFAATGRAAIAVPDGDAPTLETVAARYAADYLYLTPQGTPQELLRIFDNPQRWFDYVGAVEEGVLFAIR